MLDFPEDILDDLPDFHDRLLTGLFAHLSIHCPSYTSITGLAIDIGVGLQRFGNSPGPDSSSEEMENQRNKQFIGSDPKPKRVPPYPPSLEVFDMKTRLSTLGRKHICSTFTRYSTLKGFLYCTLPAQCSSATLRTVNFNMDLRALEVIYWGRLWQHIPPNDIPFPLVKSITLNVKLLPALRDESYPIAPRLIARFPNIEEVSISYERVSSHSISGYHSYFENLSAIPGIRKLRTFWPLTEITTRNTYELMETSELIGLTKRFVVDYNLSHLEGVDFIHDDWATERDSFRNLKRYRAIICSVTRGHRGELEIKAGKEFRDVGRLFDRSR
ncbi:hypothetical protein TWF506_002826 [Arthrobotrys conoides]|uniref:Uncharacterized protein n=1 Tax=Arthrobotrys conoides TaxID=74498 RepID=A0AAN8RKB0_9PEZI